MGGGGGAGSRAGQGPCAKQRGQEDGLGQVLGVLKIYSESQPDNIHELGCFLDLIFLPLGFCG